MKCPSCGANQVDRAACEYCGRAMPVSTEQQKVQSIQDGMSRLEIERAARNGVIWSLIGAVTCCFPISIVGIVYGLRARKLGACSA